MEPKKKKPQKNPKKLKYDSVVAIDKQIKRIQHIRAVLDAEYGQLIQCKRRLETQPTDMKTGVDRLASAVDAVSVTDDEQKEWEKLFTAYPKPVDKRLLLIAYMIINVDNDELSNYLEASDFLFLNVYGYSTTTHNLIDIANQIINQYQYQYQDPKLYNQKRKSY